MKAERIADAQHIPPRFLNNILQDLRRAGLVESHRGPVGGHKLARAADEITVADVVRAADGPLGAVAGVPPESTEYHGAATRMRETWVAARASVRDVLEHVTVADIARDELPGVGHRAARVAGRLGPALTARQPGGRSAGARPSSRSFARCARSVSAAAGRSAAGRVAPRGVEQRRLGARAGGEGGDQPALALQPVRHVAVQLARPGPRRPARARDTAARGRARAGAAGRRGRRRARRRPRG